MRIIITTIIIIIAIIIIITTTYSLGHLEIIVRVEATFLPSGQSSPIEYRGTYCIHSRLEVVVVAVVVVLLLSLLSTLQL